jgi:hypothetical protein
LEAKRPLSVGASTASLVGLKAGSHALASHPADPSGALGAVGKAPRDRAGLTGSSGPVPTRDHGPQAPAQSRQPTPPGTGFLVYRLTNPNRFNNRPIVPTYQVLVQARQPIPGQVYNVLYVTVWNGSARTFTASNGFEVKFPGEHVSSVFPILTGSEQWKPGQSIAFYVLSKQYYPVQSQVHSGFEFDLGGARSVAIPGPSGIFLRLKYNPATFARTLDSIVTFGKGAQGGVGPEFGLPDTAINAFVSARTARNDFGGYF